MNKYYLILFLFTAAKNSMGGEFYLENLDFPRPDLPLPETNEPQKMLVVIEADTNSFEEAVRRGANVDKASGYTPKKGETRVISFDELLIKKTEIQVTLSPSKKRIARRLFEEEPDAKRKCQVMGFNSNIETEGTPFLVHPMAQKTSVGIDLDHPVWESSVPEITAILVSEIAEINNDEDAAKFLLVAMRELKRRIKDFLPAIVEIESHNKINCRIYSALTLGLFNKIFEILPPEMTYGKVQTLGGEEIDENWKVVRKGHQWNIVSLAVSNCIRAFFVDTTWECVKRLRENDASPASNCMFLSGQNLACQRLETSLGNNVVKCSMERLGLLKENNFYFDQGTKAEAALAQFVFANRIWMSDRTEFFAKNGE